MNEYTVDDMKDQKLVIVEKIICRFTIDHNEWVIKYTCL